VAYVYWMQYNVKNYQTVGDGVTNDYNAIMTVINLAKVNGGTIFFPKGRYNIGSNRIRLVSNINYKGEGYDSVLCRTDGTTIFTSYIDQVNNVSLSNLRLDVTGTNSKSEYEPIFDSLDSTFNNLSIDTCWFSSTSKVNNLSLIMDNVTATISTNINISNCVFEKCGRINVEIFTNKNKNRIVIDNLKIINNKFSTTGMMCLSVVTPTKDMTVSRNQMVCNCPDVYAIGYESTPWMINAMFNNNTLSGNFGIGSISNINVVGTDIKAFSNPSAFSYVMTQNTFNDVKGTDSSLFLQGMINGTITENTFNITNSIKLDNLTNCVFSKNKVQTSARQAILIKATNGVKLVNNTLSTKNSPNQIAIVNSSAPTTVLVQDNILIKGSGGTYLSGNFTDQNNIKYDNVDPPTRRQISIRIQSEDGLPITLLPGKIITAYI
jgi:hypothetical protein